MFRTYLIGRSKQADMTIDDPSVSRLHAEFTITDSGHFFYIDRASSHGSSIVSGSGSKPLKQGYVKPDETLSIGAFRIKARDIARQLQAVAVREADASIAFEPISFTPRRNAGTGVIEKR